MRRAFLLYRFLIASEGDRSRFFTLYGVEPSGAIVCFDMDFKSTKEAKTFCKNLFFSQLEKEGFKTWKVEMVSSWNKKKEW